MDENLNIYQRMSLAEAEIARVPKNLTIGTGRFQYKAVAEADILKAVKEAETKHGIFSYPAVHRVVESRALNAGGEDNGKGGQFVRIESVYRFVNMDNPSEFVEVSAFGDGVDSLDKAPGKATTYADKYALMKAYKVETGDDTDRTASDDLAGHDIWKIKQRVELLLTEKMKAGASQSEIIQQLRLSQKQFDACMNAFQNVATFEARLKKL